MENYITSYKLINLQSWDDSSPAIELDNDIVNIIEGPNETGKSVFFKAFYSMCFPENSDSRELIRRGCDTAFFILWLSNGYQIVYQLTAGHHVHALFHGDDVETWCDTALPSKIADMLGLILDRESRVILNIIDKDIPMPFISSSPKTNASYIRAVVEPVRMTEFFSRTEEQLKEVDSARQKFKSKMEAARDAANVLEHRNIDALKEKKRIVDSMNLVVQKYVMLEKSVQGLLATYASEPVPVKNPNGLAHFLKAYNKVDACTNHLSYLCNLLNSPPVVINSPKVVESKFKIADSVSKVIAAIKGLSTLYLRKPVEPNVVCMQQLYKAYQQCETVSWCAKSLKGCMQSLAELEQKMNLTNEELERIKREVGVCPTCGRLLGD